MAYERLLKGKEFTFTGTVFLKHEDRKDWFTQYSIYIRPGEMVICKKNGKGQGPQKNIEKALGTKVTGDALTHSAIGFYSLMEGCEQDEALEHTKYVFNATFENAVWLWAK